MPYFTTAVKISCYNRDTKPGEALGIRELTVIAETQGDDVDDALRKAENQARSLVNDKHIFSTQSRIGADAFN